MNSFDRERLRIQRAKMLYPPGTRIVLGEMSDPYAPVPPGTRGTVKFVDDMGTIHPQWDNGRTLGLIYGEDSFRKLTQEELDRGGLCDRRGVFLFLPVDTQARCNSETPVFPTVPREQQEPCDRNYRECRRRIHRLRRCQSGRE